MNKSPNDIMLQKLSDSLDSTSKLTQLLLGEIRESEGEFAVVKTELGILRDNFKELSAIIREGNGAASIITRVALIEQKLEVINKWMDSHADLHMRNKDDYNKVLREIEELDDRVSDTEKYVKELQDKKKREEDDERASIHKQKEIEHHTKITSEKTKAASAEATQKIIVAVITAILTLGAAWAMKLFH